MPRPGDHRLKTFYLHIGHDKTGSSFLQSILARNCEQLENSGIHYPVEEGAQIVASRGHVTSGNRRIVETPEWTKLVRETSDGAPLISYEGLFNQAGREPDKTLPIWETWRQELGCDRISILLFIRDPIDHAASLFQQASKTSNMKARSLSQYFMQYKRPTQLLTFMKKTSEIPTIDVTVRNYSRCKRDVVAITENWLGLDPKTLSTDGIPRSVNRSLTFAELRTVLALSRYSKIQSLELANRFSNTLPERKPFRAVPPIATQDAMLTKFQPVFEELKEYIAEEDQYQLEKFTPTKGSKKLDDEQLQVVNDFVAGSKSKRVNLWRAAATRWRFRFT